MEETITTANILSTLELLSFIQFLLAIGYKGMLGKSEIQNVMQKCYKIYNVEPNINQIANIISEPNITLELINYTGFWDKNNLEKPVLKNINFKSKQQQFTAILGAVSSGKTSFLNIFMSEIPHHTGSIGVQGNIAFAEAEPYIFIGTIRDNIVLDAVYNHEWYQEVLEKCCILDDICKLKNQDQSMVGDNSGGIQLSGGQKARISLARAVYQRKEIYLLDDPLSAVDVNIARKLLKNVIKGLLKDKAVILATHQMDMIQEYVDHVVYIKDQTIFTQGSYLQVIKKLQQNDIIPQFVEETPKNNTILQFGQYQQISEKDNENENESEEKSQSQGLDSSTTSSNEKQNPMDTSLNQRLKQINKNIKKSQQKSLQSPSKSNKNKSPRKIEKFSPYNNIKRQSLKSPFQPPQSSQAKSSIFELDDDYDYIDEGDDLNDEELDEDYIQFDTIQNIKPKIKRFQMLSYHSNNISKKEESAINQISNKNSSKKLGFQVYKQYILMLGPIIFTILSVLHFFFDYYLFLVIFELFGEFQEKNTQQKYELTIKIFIYAFIFFISQIIRTQNWCQLHLRGMYKLHQKMLTIIIKASSQYFDKTPIGNILNKFSNDLGICDIQLFQFIFDFTDKWLQTLVLMGYICYINQLLISIMLIQLFFLLYFYKISKLILSSSRSLDLQNKNPIFSLLSNTISGITNLNIYGLIPAYKIKFTNLVNNSQRCSYSFWILQRAFGLIGQQINSFFGNAVMFLIIFISINQIQNEDKLEDKEIIVSNLGIVIVYILKMQDIVPRAVRQTTKIDIGFNSFNRINQYLDQIPQEKENKSVKKNEFQIVNGDITFKNVTLQYDPKSKPVLKDLSINIKQGEKIAIVGRSGAGKSTVFQALLRIKEIEDFENQSRGIFIDQQRIQNFSLQQVRNSISIIPQTPFLYTGSIKFNLDPYNKCNDDQIKLLLAELNLSDYLQQQRIDLNTQITQETSLFSIGQKQLICLGRAILQQNKILVVDEATANCDKQTDEQIQDLIKKKFKDCTVLTIAHRLDTIADSDKILVLDYGKSLDYDHPHNLLQQSDTNIFQQMVDQMEPKQKKNIYKIAQKAFYKQQQIK